MKLIFAGTPEFAIPTLKALVDSSHQVIGVYTQPDRAAGRGRKITSSPVKKYATAQGIPVYQPTSLKDKRSQNELQALAADIMIVIAYGLILPQSILDIPRYGCLNVHASLLPNWRGAAPIQRAIEAGDSTSGITIMQMNSGLDTGDILLQQPITLTDDETAATLHDKLASLGATLLLESLIQIERGTIKSLPQNDAQATYAAKITKAEALIDWTQSAIQIERKIRAFNPWPIAHTTIAEGSFRVWRATAITSSTGCEPATIIAVSQDGIDIATGEGILRITQLQLAGGKVLPVNEILNGKENLFKLGAKLGK